jgi:TonB-dependent Receptor Plug Domain
VRAAGMKELDRTDIHLDPNQVLGLGNVQMAVGATAEHITVEAQTPLVETADSDHSSVIDSRQVTETLLNGRDFQSLLKTLPGVTSNNGSDFQLQFNNTDEMHINGLRGSANNVFLDGAINTDVGANDGQYTQLSMDAVGEFKVETSNFAAEYGRNPGVLIAINTKSGTDQFHGTLYEFNREDGFGGIPYGATATSFLRFNQFGGNLGGPIPMPHAKKKMFFFFNYEGTRGLRPGNTQFANKILPGVGQGYNLPDPAWIGLGTPGGEYDFTSAYSYDTSGNPVLNPNGYNVGQIFVPGSITQYDSSGRPLNGTPICGTSPANACNIIAANSPLLSSQAAAWVNYWKPHYLPGFIPDPSSINNRPAALGGPLDSKVFVPYNETYTLFKHQEVIRYDWNINPKTNFFFRWVDDSQTENYHNLFDFADYPVLPEFRKKPGSSWSWNLVNVISPTMTNEFIFSYNHLTQVVDIAPGTPTSTYDFNQLGFTFQQLYPNSNLDNRAPVLNDCCNGTFTGGSFHPGWHSEARQFTWTDNVTKVLGPHTVKFGVFYDYNQAGQQPVWDDTTFLKFDTGSSNPADSNSYVANVLFGNFTQAQQTNGTFFGAFRFHQVEAFGQDSWKVNRKLTLDYGVRWGYLGPTYTVQPFFANYFDVTKYDPSQAVTLNTTQGNFFGDICTAALQAIAGNCVGVTNFGNPYNGIVQENHGIPAGFADHRYNNFGPRFGFSYDPFGDGKTAIRGGIGVFYERIRQNVNSFDLLGNPPLSYTATVFNGKVDQLGPQDVNGVLSPSGINAFDKTGQIPTITGYSLGIQREMPAQIGLEVAYVGNTTRHLQYQYNLNALPIGSQTAPTLPQPFYSPYAGYSNINYTKYDATSDYNSLQIKATRRFHRDLTLTADYVWSKAMDIEDVDNGNINATNGGGNALTDPYHPHSDWAPAGYDRTNVFNLNYVYTIPYHGTGGMKYLLGGWELGGLWKWWSGPPLDVTINGAAGNFVGVVRPDLASGVPVYVDHSNHVNWLNPEAFLEPQAGSVGSIGRNAFRGPGINNWDMSVFKNIHFTERMYLQLRLESYNTFNHTQPNNVNIGFSAPAPGAPPTLPAGTQGQITGFRDPRELQLGAKFYF